MLLAALSLSLGMCLCSFLGETSISTKYIYAEVDKDIFFQLLVTMSGEVQLDKTSGGQWHLLHMWACNPNVKAQSICALAFY